MHHFLKTPKCFILIQIPVQLDIWVQSYEGFDNGKNNIKQRNLNSVLANISKTTLPTSDSFLLIMSHICKYTHVVYLLLLLHTLCHMCKHLCFLGSEKFWSHVEYCYRYKIAYVLAYTGTRGVEEQNAHSRDFRTLFSDLVIVVHNKITIWAGTI